MAFLKKFSSSFSQLKEAGLGASFRRLWWYNTAKTGQLVGTDEFGNQYYQNMNVQTGRDRWVEYPKYTYDASQVPPTWHAWLHHSTDIPGKDMGPFIPVFLEKHPANRTGTKMSYSPRNFLMNKNFKEDKFISTEFDPNKRASVEGSHNY